MTSNASNQKNRRARIVIAMIGLLAITMPVAAEEEVAVNTEVSASAPTPTKAMSKRARRAQESQAELQALLALIPDTHPLRSDLRRVVLQGIPAGYSAEEWLNLAMKVDFRSGPSKQLAQAE